MPKSRLASVPLARLATYTTAAGGVLVAGTAAQADLMVYENFGSLDASTSFSIDLGVIATGAKFVNQGRFSNTNNAFIGMYIGLSGTTQGRFDLTPRDAGFSFNNSNGTFQNFGQTTFLGPGNNTAGINSQLGTYYVGFKVQASDFLFRYGWVEYVYSSSNPNVVTVSRWAYESNGFSGAVAGATGTVADGGGGGAVPGLGGLAALAMGAAGMRRSRGRVA